MRLRVSVPLFFEYMMVVKKKRRREEERDNRERKERGAHLDGRHLLPLINNNNVRF